MVIRDLFPEIELGSTNCLNESAPGSVKSIFSQSSSGYLESDCDEQLLISVKFNQPVRLHSILMCGVEGRSDQSPREVYLVVNRATVGFSDAESQASAAMTLQKSQADAASAVPVTLKLAKFNGVQNITLFVKSNQSDDEKTIVGKLRFFGETASFTDMSQLKKSG